MNLPQNQELKGIRSVFMSQVELKNIKTTIENFDWMRKKALRCRGGSEINSPSF